MGQIIAETHPVPLASVSFGTCIPCAAFVAVMLSIRGAAIITTDTCTCASAGVKTDKHG